MNAWKIFEKKTVMLEVMERRMYDIFDNNFETNLV